MGVPKRDGGAAYVWEGKYVKKIQWQLCPLGNTRAKNVLDLQVTHKITTQQH